LNTYKIFHSKSGNKEAGESGEDRGKDGFRTLKKIYKGWE
jgi:hypothetical protein